VGTSKRYAHYYDAQMDLHVVQGIMRTGDPKTLDAKEIDLEHEDLTRPPVARPARAWVEYGEHAIEVDVEVTAWTSRAVAIRWKAYDDVEHRAWVWQGAVSERRRRDRPPQAHVPSYRP
jgi:hypothetical protein